MAKNKIYVSDAKGYTPIDSEGVIVRFRPFHVMDMSQMKGVWKGCLVTNDASMIARLEAHPDKGKGFKEVSTLPDKLHARSIVHGVRASGMDDAAFAQLNEKEQEAIRKARAEEMEKIKRLGVLESQILKTDGEYKANVNSGFVQEYEKLKEELGV